MLNKLRGINLRLIGNVFTLLIGITFGKILKTSNTPITQNKDSQCEIPFKYAYTIAKHETGDFSGRLYKKYHNPFSLKYNGKFLVFHDDLEGTIAFMDRMRNFRYKKAHEFACNKQRIEFFRALQEAGYATDPHYAEKLERVYQEEFGIKSKKRDSATSEQDSIRS